MTQGMSCYYSFKDQGSLRIEAPHIAKLCVESVQFHGSIFRTLLIAHKIHTNIHINKYKYMREEERVL